MPTLFETSDGSITLCDPASGQAMHAKEGAYSETKYIYGEAFLRIVQQELPASVMVVGLGLGYIELMVIAYSLKEKTKSLQITSFENNDEYRLAFLAWLRNEESKFNPIYEKICQRLAADLQVSGIKESAQDLYLKERWKIHRELELQLVSTKHSLICYDPYSSSANPTLWQEKWLTEFMSHSCSQTCVFTTYASNGNLKRALHKCGFTLLEKPGFGMKRESTLATRS